ncbi:MAG: hypothetical protein B7Y05_00860 [Polynucleobacter sp. 24-46-87]|jgi:hypothetical protein|uniref:hypothetical protein n=1 Tax=Polynucleobacter sp. 35-46-11 TaxID=1970425 RepID=UPI000BCE4950|nr:hypothetical protein [Polynucleobacter sp. 35-46-11]OYY21315.1 MAG: hypothetical protein B7Y67_02155 [Polynucleobacter sp. 35-46-11]OZA16232.1 MAG: hypothetical protein B7Y05_00860 [Polynucleobacter sp. 24-46-87]
MNITTRLKAIVIFGITLGFAFPMTVIAQTFSPYTSEQIQEFNNQPIAPMETPAGPVYLERPPVSQKPNAPFDSRYIKNPDGEEQAEAQGSESAAPFKPIPATFAF